MLLELYVPLNHISVLPYGMLPLWQAYVLCTIIFFVSGSGKTMSMLLSVSLAQVSQQHKDHIDVPLSFLNESFGLRAT